MIPTSPDVCICTHFFIFSCISDPVVSTAHAETVSVVDANCDFPERDRFAILVLVFL